jgi:hypothetical protein
MERNCSNSMFWRLSWIAYLKCWRDHVSDGGGGECRWDRPQTTEWRSRPRTTRSVLSLHWQTKKITKKKKIGGHRKGFEAICVNGFPGIRLLQSIPIQIHEKLIGIPQMVLFFWRMSNIQRIWPSCARGASESVMDIGTLQFIYDVLAYMPHIYYLSPTVEHCLVTQPEPRISSALLCGRVTVSQCESVGYDSVASSI